MEPEVLWLVLAAVLVVAELLTVTIALGMLGAAALLTALVAVLGGGIVLQSVTFGVTSLALLVLVRPPVQRMLTSRDDASTDARALSGSTAVVVERVSDDSGQVRLHGELWRARPYAGGAPVEVGREVSVAAVEGATLLVYSPDLT